MKPNAAAQMSRRKQSNPKPLKREDEDDDPEEKRLSDQPSEEPEDTTKKPTSNCSVSSPQVSPTQSAASASSPKSPPAPKVRLNPALATDPADNINATSSQMDYLAALPPAFHQAALAGRLFSPFPADPDLAKARLKGGEILIEPRPVSAFMCAPCGIRFSSASTLEAHQTYYCSHRIAAKGRESDADDPKSPSAEDGTEPPAKMARTGKQYGCPHCSYSADKKVSLNRHMRMHASSPIAPTTNGNSEPNESQLTDRYCQDCDIRFSSIKTLKAHKMHYCSSRHGKLSPGGKSGSVESPGDPEEESQRGVQPYLILRTNPVLIVPYSLFQSAASFFPDSNTSLPCQDTACILLPNGTLKPMSHLLPADDPVILKDTRTDRNRKPDQPSSPLDLSIRRSSSTDRDLVIDEDEKENVCGAQETIVSTPSIPVILAAAEGKQKSPTPPPKTPSPRRGPNGIKEPKKLTAEQQSALNLLLASSGRVPPPTILSSLMTLPPVPGPAPTELLPLLNDLQMGAPPIAETVPQVLVKQGVSKCQECNIVFCKHESYLAHKKHYCSARANDSLESRRSPSDSRSPGNSEGNISPKTTPLVQLICLNCNTKFSSLDNLMAHQNFYCQKRQETLKVDEKIKRCPKCKMAIQPSVEHQCAQSSNQTGGWKCPCCDVVSLTAATAQKHMETHAGVKAFRCTICRYKGNTLRGMRTHIRMHLDKANGDMQEENFISCIIDESAVSPPVNLPPPPPPPPPPTPPTIKQETEEELVDVEADTPASPTPASSEMPTLEETSNNNRRQQHGQNYCKACNITFTYVSSLVAHKKFYCSSHSPRGTPETPVG